MKDFADALINTILEREASKINKIMQYVAEKIQIDAIGCTYAVLDAYYNNYSPEYYIRTDELSQRNRGSNGRFTKKLKKERKRDTKRYSDISLRTAMMALGESGQPAIGVCKPLDNGLGYQAGVLFDPGYFDKAMKHSVKGFNEWDIVENFLFGQHGNGSKFSSVTPFTEPYADMELRNFINTYSSKFDKHYRDAYKKFK